MNQRPNRSWVKEHSLGIALFLAFIVSWIAQFLFTIPVVFNEAVQHGQEFAWKEFWSEFFKDTFENWESEFLQLLTFVIFTKKFVEKGSKESKEPEEV